MNGIFKQFEMILKNTLAKKSLAKPYIVLTKDFANPQIVQSGKQATQIGHYI